MIHGLSQLQMASAPAVARGISGLGHGANTVILGSWCCCGQENVGQNERKCCFVEGFIADRMQAQGCNEVRGENIM